VCQARALGRVIDLAFPQRQILVDCPVFAGPEVGHRSNLTLYSALGAAFYLSEDQVGRVTVAEVLQELVSGYHVLIVVGQELRRLYARTTMCH